MMSNQINILLVDDHAMFLDGLERLLNNYDEFKIIDKITMGSKVLNVLEKEVVDIVITDMDMPTLNGLELTELIRKGKSEIKILALSMHKEYEVIDALIEAGANGYLLKDSSANELYDAIHAVMLDKAFYCKKTAEILISSRNKPKKASPTEVDLSDREKDILKLIAEELTQNEIAEKLNISPHTVVFHKRKMISKLEVKGTVGLVRKAIELGLMDQHE